MKNKMGSRYWITGTQIGTLWALNEFGDESEVRYLLQKILDNQHLGKKVDVQKLIEALGVPKFQGPNK